MQASEFCVLMSTVHHILEWTSYCEIPCLGDEALAKTQMWIFSVNLVIAVLSVDSKQF